MRKFSGLEYLFWMLLALAVALVCFLLGLVGAGYLFVLAVQKLRTSGLFPTGEQPMLFPALVVAALSGGFFIGFLGVYWMKRWPYLRAQEIIERKISAGANWIQRAMVQRSQSKEDWGKIVSKGAATIVGDCLRITGKLNPDLTVKYWDCGVFVFVSDSEQGKPSIILFQSKRSVTVSARIKNKKPWISKFEAAGIRVRWNPRKSKSVLVRFRIGEVQKCEELLTSLFSESFSIARTPSE